MTTHKPLQRIFFWRKIPESAIMPVLTVLCVLFFYSAAYCGTVTTISGVVLDESVAPIQGAAVLLVDAFTDTTIVTATTDSSGQFTFEMVVSGEYHLKVTNTLYPEQWYSVYGNTIYPQYYRLFGALPVDTVTINIVSIPVNNEPPSGVSSVVALVKSVDSVPLENATVYLYSSSMYNQNFSPLYNNTPYQSKTDSMGKAVLSGVPSGEYFSYVKTDSLNYIGQYYNTADYITGAQIFVVDTNGFSLSFALRKGGVLNGHIHTSSGAPVANAHVYTQLIDKNVRYESISDSAGNYLLQGLLAGTYSVSFMHTSYIVAGTLLSNQYSVNENTTAAIPDIVMDSGGYVSGSVTSETSLNDSSSGIYPSYRGVIKLYRDTVSDTAQKIKWMDYTTNLKFVISDQTGLAGTFTSEILPAGTYRVLFTPEPQSWSTGTTTESVFVKSSGWSFLTQPASTVPAVVSVELIDTVKSLSLNIRKGYSVFGKLLTESDSEFTGANYNIGIHTKIDNKYYCVATAYKVQNGVFEIPGLVDGEEYYVEINADGYPHQFWNGTDSNTAQLSAPWKFSVSGNTVPNIYLSKSITDTSSIKQDIPFTSWIEMTAMGETYLKWTIADSLKADTFYVYTKDNTDQFTQLSSIARNATFTTYQFREARALTSAVQYAVVAKGVDRMYRSSIAYFNPSSINQTLWIDIVKDRHGISIQTGFKDSLSLTQSDSLYIYKRVTGESWKLLGKTGIYNTWFNDNSWSHADSLKTFEYKVECPSRNIVSLVKTVTLDDAFFAVLSKGLLVGPYEKYTTIQAAINAAQSYDNIEIKNGVYKENINFNGKILFLHGQWENGKPPVIDASGGIAVSVPYYQSVVNGAQAQVSGLKITNASKGVYTEDAIQINNCLFTNCRIAVANSSDTSRVSAAFLSNPFVNILLNSKINQCTFIACNQGDQLLAVSIPAVVQETTLFAWPVKNVSVQYQCDNNLVCYYNLLGGNTVLPVKTEGPVSVTFNYTDFYETAVSSPVFSVVVNNALTVNPLFIDTVYCFLPDQSPLRNAGNGQNIGYDSWMLTNQQSSRLKAVANIVRRNRGMKAVQLSWDRSVTDTAIAYYTIYRLPADSSLFFINETGSWEPKSYVDTLTGVMDSFATTSTTFIDSTIIPGIPYIYAIAAVDSFNNEGIIDLPSSMPLSTYAVNSYQYSFKIRAEKWYMLCPWGTQSVDIPKSPSIALYEWDDSRETDKLYSQYVQVTSMVPGKGYWLKSLSDTSITVNNPAISVLADLQDSLKISCVKGTTGWHQFASTLPVPIAPAWLSIIPVWEWIPDSSGYVRAYKLDPWNAYWVHSDQDTVLSLRDNGTLQSVAKKLVQSHWELNVSLTGKNTWDHENYCGIIPSSLARSSRMVEEPEPPQAFGFPSLYFLKNDSTVTNSGNRLSYYYRTGNAVPEQKITWAVGLSSNENQSSIHIDGLATVPGNVFVFWIDNNRIINLRNNNTIEMQSHNNTLYGYIVVTANPAEIAVYSGKFIVCPPYPNPFRESTVIDFFVPSSWSASGLLTGGEAQLVTMDLYDILGRHTGQIYNKQIAAGNHRFIWNGCDMKNRTVASGFYLLKIKCADNRATIKMARIK